MMPRPALRPMRAKPKATSWPYHAIAGGLFLISIALLSMSTWRYVKAVRRPERAPAHEAIDVFSLARTPTVAAGKFRYSILGYGQDEMTGRQIVWVRSITTNHVGGFAAGDKLFDGPVSVEAITDDRLALSYRGGSVEVPIQP